MKEQLWKKVHLLRCAAFLIIAAYNLKVTRETIRLILRNLRALHLNLACPLGYFAKPFFLKVHGYLLEGR